MTTHEAKYEAKRIIILTRLISLINKVYSTFGDTPEFCESLSRSSIYDEDVDKFVPFVDITLQYDLKKEIFTYLGIKDDDDSGDDIL